MEVPRPETRYVRLIDGTGGTERPAHGAVTISLAFVGEPLRPHPAGESPVPAADGALRLDLCADLDRVRIESAAADGAVEGSPSEWSLDPDSPTALALR